MNKQIIINGKVYAVVGKDGSDLIVMTTAAGGEIREFRLTVGGKLERIN